MKKTLITLLFCCVVSLSYAQQRQFPVKTILQFIGAGTSGLKLTQWGLNGDFKYVDKSDGIYQYINQTRWGSFTLLIGTENSKLTAISWTEFAGYEQVVQNELTELGFVLIPDPNGNFVNFQNQKLKRSATVLMRPRTHDIFITLSTLSK